MKIIIAGDGKVGLTLTQKLAAAGHDLTLIDSNQRVLDSSVERYDVMGVQGNCASMRVLESADVKKADLLIAATSSDEVNLLCGMTAHGLNPRIHTIARIRNPEYGKQIFTMRDVYSLSLMVNPEKQAAREIERLIRYPGFLQRETFAKSRVEIVELRRADRRYAGNYGSKCGTDESGKCCQMQGACLRSEPRRGCGDSIRTFYSPGGGSSVYYGNC